MIGAYIHYYTVHTSNLIDEHVLALLNVNTFVYNLRMILHTREQHEFGCFDSCIMTVWQEMLHFPFVRPIFLPNDWGK